MKAMLTLLTLTLWLTSFAVAKSGTTTKSKPGQGGRATQQIAKPIETTPPEQEAVP